MWRPAALIGVALGCGIQVAVGADHGATVENCPHLALDFSATYRLCGRAPRGLEEFGATGDDELDDTTAIQAALAAGVPLTGDGKLYLVSGNITLPDGTFLQDAKLRQLAPDNAYRRTLTNAGVGPITLVRVTVDRNGAPADGSISDAAGIWFGRMRQPIWLEDVEVTGDGKGKGIFIANSPESPVVAIRPYIHDIRWGDSHDSGLEQVVGFFCAGCSNVYVEAPHIENLDGLIAWAPGEAITPARGVQYRFNGDHGYKALNRGTTAEPGPACTSGRCTDGGGVVWQYLGSAEAAARAYQTDGLDFAGTSNATVNGGLIRNVGEGSDVSGSKTNASIWFFNTRYEDIDAWGQKWVHHVVDSGSIGCTVLRAGLGGFVVAGSVEPDPGPPTNLRIVDATAIDSGANRNWEVFSNLAAFTVGAGPMNPVNIQFINPKAIDTQAAPTMKHGFRNEPGTPSAMTLINPRVERAAVADGLTIPADSILPAK